MWVGLFLFVFDIFGVEWVEFSVVLWNEVLFCVFLKFGYCFNGVMCVLLWVGEFVDEQWVWLCRVDFVCLDWVIIVCGQGFVLWQFGIMV